MSSVMVGEYPDFQNFDLIGRADYVADVWFLSMLLNHKVPVIVVCKMLGHSKPSITLDIYGHLYNEMQEEAAEVMDKLVTPIQVQFPQTAKYAER